VTQTLVQLWLHTQVAVWLSLWLSDAL